MKYLVHISRLLLGLVFMFSGTVKAIDPLGSTYKFVDYFNAFSMSWAVDLAFPLAILLNVLEFMVGFALFFSLFPRLAAWGAFLFMAIFTPLTLYLALKNPVTDCGCFGDAIIMTNWETFYKNLILIILSIILIFRTKMLNSWFNRSVQKWSVLVVAVLAVAFQIYTYFHLPLVDFRPYKVGTHIPDKMIIPDDAPREKSIYYYPMKHLETGEVTKISSDEYLADTKWQNPNAYEIIADQIEGPIIIEEGYKPPIHDLSIELVESETFARFGESSDVLTEILEREGYTFLIVAYDLKKANKKALERLNLLSDWANKNQWEIMALTAAPYEEIQELRQEIDLNYYFYNTDPITLKTIIRANPGIVLLRNATILGKWHVNDLPDNAYFREKYLNN